MTYIIYNSNIVVNGIMREITILLKLS